MTVNTRVIRLVLERTDLITVTLRDGLRVQILPSIKFLPSCQRFQNAAFIKDQAILVIWADSPKDVVAEAKKIEQQMVEVFAEGLEYYDEKPLAKESHTVLVTEKSLDDSGPGENRLVREDGLLDANRKTVLNQAILTAITLFLIIAALGSGWRQIAIQIMVDHNWLRLAFIIVVPLQIWLALVSCEIHVQIGIS